MTPEIAAKVQLWRSKVVAGTITEGEMKEAILVLREGRVGASIASEKSRAKKNVKVAVVDADDLLDELKGL